VIECKSQVQGLNIRSTMTFSMHGLVVEKTNLRKNVSTKKTFVRLKNDAKENIEDDMNGLLDTTVDPLTDEDWAWE